MHYLAARTGPSKGQTWPISEHGVVIGRDLGCDVRIADPMVSRRHCRIAWTGGKLRLEDLKSSNTTLVNGAPSHDSVLRAGDEVAVGNVVFLILDIDGAAPEFESAVRETAEPRTVTLSEADAIYLTESTVMERLGRPQTTHDLAFLFALGRTLSGAESRETLLAMLTAKLREVFTPAHVWFALRNPRSGEIDYEAAPGSAGIGRPHELLEAAIRDKRGMIAPVHGKAGKTPTFATVMLAPFIVGGEPMGAVAVHGGDGGRVYDESDLELLLAAGHQAAPFLVTVEQVEQLRRDNERLRQTAELPEQIGESPAFARVVELMRRAALSDLSVLVLGETGTGKELAARFIHDHSNRRHGPFVALNCAAIPRELLESELFGHVRGSFTGADRDHTGHLEQAHKGTLFLDEIGDLSPPSQASILRAIETGSFRRVGAEKETRVDVRIVCATNKPLRENIDRGEFRSDLFHRLAGFEVELPPLRDRPSDIPLLAEHYFKRFQHKARKPLRGFTPAAMAFLQAHPWPGNIRELRSAVERAIHICPGDTIDADDLRPAHSAAAPAEDAMITLAAMEQRYVQAVVRRCEGNISAAARILGVSRNTLYNKLNSLP